MGNLCKIKFRKERKSDVAIFYVVLSVLFVTSVFQHTVRNKVNILCVSANMFKNESLWNYQWFSRRRCLDCWSRYLWTLNWQNESFKDVPLYSWKFSPTPLQSDLCPTRRPSRGCHAPVSHSNPESCCVDFNSKKGESLVTVAGRQGRFLFLCHLNANTAHNYDRDVSCYVRPRATKRVCPVPR